YAWPQARAAEFARMISSADAATQRLLPALYRRAGVQQRHSVLLSDGTGAPPEQSFYESPSPASPHGPTTAERMAAYAEYAPPLAAAAARKAFAVSSIDAGEITHLITASCTGFNAPGIDA